MENGTNYPYKSQFNFKDSSEMKMSIISHPEMSLAECKSTRIRRKEYDDSLNYLCKPMLIPEDFRKLKRQIDTLERDLETYMSNRLLYQKEIQATVETLRSISVLAYAAAKRMSKKGSKLTLIC